MSPFTYQQTPGTFVTSRMFNVLRGNVYQGKIRQVQSGFWTVVGDYSGKTYVSKTEAAMAASR